MPIRSFFVRNFPLVLVAFAFISMQGFAADRELIGDNYFQRGFVLRETKPGNHVRYGELVDGNAKAKPVWGLSQWSSKFPLDPAAAKRARNGATVCTNEAKGVIFARPNSSSGDFTMMVNTGAEYGHTARKAGTPWVHLLVEQGFASPAKLSEIQSAKLHV